MSLESLSMDSVQEFVTSNKAKLDLAWQILLYLPLISRPQFLRHLTSSKYAKYGNWPYIPLLIHIFVSLITIGRYHFRAVSSTVAPEPEIFDMASGVATGILSWRLCKYEHRGNPFFARVGFQVMSIMVVYASVMCYMTTSPGWYFTLVRMHNAFAYVRWFQRIGGSLRIFMTPSEGYSMAVFTGGLLAIWDAKFPWDGLLGVPLALVLHVWIIIAEKFASSLITPENTHPGFLLKMMLIVGLVEVKAYKAPEKPVVTPADSKNAADSAK